MHLAGVRDDATSRLMHLQFVESESTFAYFNAARAYLEAWASQSRSTATSMASSASTIPGLGGRNDAALVGELWGGGGMFQPACLN
jgi:hypothetical protein